MKIELDLPLIEIVRLHDLLQSADIADPHRIISYVVGRLEGIISNVETRYEESLLELNSAEKEMAVKGDRIAAIRALRDRTGASLKAAKDAVDRAVPRFVVTH